jgi:hypothetical protein
MATLSESSAYPTYQAVLGTRWQRLLGRSRYCQPHHEQYHRSVKQQQQQQQQFAINQISQSLNRSINNQSTTNQPTNQPIDLLDHSDGSTHTYTHCEF